MKINTSIFIPYFIVVVVIYLALGFSKEKYEAEGKIRLEKMYGKKNFFIESINGASPRRGKIYLEDIFNLKTLSYTNDTYIAQQVLSNVGRYSISRGDIIQKANHAAYGSDGKAYFSNGFLIGFAPYKVNTVWEPMQVISQRLKYAYDKDMFGGSSEIWQTSQEAYARLRGDCEDHAFVVADWLIQMGYDARVVIGRYKNSGHAWVVLFHNNQEFLIEATSKNKQIKHYPLATLYGSYKPQAMFNHQFFWRKLEGSSRNYSDGWKKTSTFQENSL